MYNTKQQALDNAYATLIKRAKKILSETKGVGKERKEIIVPTNNIKVSG